LSKQVLAVAWSGRGSIQAQALTLVTGVEAIVNGFYGDRGVPDAATITSVNSLIDHITSWKVDETVAQRAVDLVGVMKAATTRSRLRNLHGEGSVSKSGMDAWILLRNPVAHGDWKRFEDVQALIDAANKVRLLLYQLTFKLIGFSGQHTDYGTRGFPLMDYPPRNEP
jgi:hypothetical protein